MISQKGKNNYFYGKHHTEETKKKISKANKGKKKPLFTEEHKRKLSEKLKGRHLTEKTRKKLSEIHKKLKTKPPSRKGTINSIEQRRKISNSLKGEKSYNWQGGITVENTKVRNSIEFRLWREAVFARDNWTCQKCGVRGGKLHSHHIQNFAQYPELRFAIDNGITFCVKDHRLFHKIYERRNNNQNQLNSFKSLKRKNKIKI